MLGVDLGLNVGSIICVRKGLVRKNLVLTFPKEKDLSEFERIRAISLRFIIEISKMRYKDVVAIEEPIFSWGRKNPKGFAKNVMLLTLILDGLIARKIPYILINPKTAKKFSGSGKNKKKQMIEAYFKRTGMYPGHRTKKGQETLADSFFIAEAGYGLRREGK